MRINVDVERSIKATRIVARDLNWEQWSSIIISGILATLFLAITIVYPITFVIQNYISAKANFNFITIAFLSLLCAGGFLTVYGLYCDNKLVKIKGTDSAINKAIMLKTIKRQFNTDLVYEGEKILTHYRRATFWRFSLRLIVLFDEDIVLISVSRFNQIGIKGFMHPLFSKLFIVDSIAEAFTNAITNLDQHGNERR